MIKVKHFDSEGNEFIKFDIIPNLKHLIKRLEGGSSTRKKLKFLMKQNHTCVLCGKKAYYIGFYKSKSKKQDVLIDLFTKEGIKLNVDHIIPTCKGGSNAEINKQCTCYECNHKKADKLPVGFKAIIGDDGKFIPYYRLD